MEICDPADGSCPRDPCTLLRCPEGEMCVRGECVEESTAPDGGSPDGGGRDGGGRDGGSGGMDAGPEDDYILASGGGGCACRAGPAPGRAPPIGLLLLGLLLGLPVWRRR
jgi:MYXO-CTERM domain-containing protein